MTDVSQHPPSRNREVSLELSSEMVRLYKELFGRGPGRALTHFAGPDTIVCRLERTFTPAERSLVALGEHQRLRETRMFFQHASERDFRDAVERITGRKVIAFVSGTDTNADVSCEVFFLEPLGSRNGGG
jgi:uncharacterized protein YbcI